MKKLGEEFKTARENMGVSLDEAANDLNIEKLTLENLEEGNTKTFKDILKIKEIITSYSKYLGLDQEEMLDEYNDFMFATTSKISVEDIKEAQKRSQQDAQEKKIKSPYTIETKKEKNTVIFIVSAVLVILILVLVFLLLKENIIG